MKLFFCDLETTGLDSSKHAICQMAGSVVINGHKVESFDYKVRPFPGAMISKEYLEVTGRTVEEMREFPTEQECYRELMAVLGRHVSKYDKADKFFWVGYNANFDVNFAREFFKRQGDQYFGSWFWSQPVFDLMPVAGMVWPELRPKLPNFKLGTVAEALGLTPSGGLHDAGVDIDLTIQLYERVVERIGSQLPAAS